MSAVEDLFRTYVDGGYAFLQELVAEASVLETDLIDFKQASQGKGPMKGDDKKNFSKALSGFGNSTGGLIVWGIDCRRSTSEPGSSHTLTLKPLANIRRFLTDLNALTAQLSSPGIPGVIHELIPDPIEEDIGFIVSLIPEYSGPPVQATVEGDGRYYYRAQESFLVMPQWMLSDRFGRVVRPQLTLNWFLTVVDMSSAKYRTICLNISNEGLAMGEHITLAINLDESSKIEALSPASLNGFRDHEINDPKRRVLTGNAVLHPGLSVDVAEFRIRLGLALYEKPLTEIKIVYGLYCDGFVMQDTLVIPIPVIEELANARMK